MTQRDLWQYQLTRWRDWSCFCVYWEVEQIVALMLGSGAKGTTGKTPNDQDKEILHSIGQLLLWRPSKTSASRSANPLHDVLGPWSLVPLQEPAGWQASAKGRTSATAAAPAEAAAALASAASAAAVAAVAELRQSCCRAAAACSSFKV